MIGFIIFIGLLNLEIILFFTTLKSKNYHYRLIKNVRIFILAFLVILLIFDVLTWSFRYYGLLFILFAMILKGYRDLSKDRKEYNPYTYKKNAHKTILAILLYGLMVLPWVIFPEYRPLATTGVYKVETSTFIVEDEGRIESFSDQNNFRQIGVHAWYPENGNETYPLIIYSHGGISLDTSNESLFLELASHGYVVFSIGHPYHSILTKNSEGKNIWINSEYMQELNSEDAKNNPEESYQLYQKWMKLRTDDLNYIIDYTKIMTQANNNLSIFKQIDSQNIGVIGHSLGGSAALCIGRNRNDVKAIIALESPFMCDILGVEDQTFIIDENIYPVPVLNVYSDSTWSNLSVFPQYAQNHILLNSNESNVRNVYIQGTGHFSLTDLSLTSPMMTRMLNGFRSTRDSKEVLYTINSTSLSFFNEFLKNE